MKRFHSQTGQQPGRAAGAASGMDHMLHAANSMVSGGGFHPGQQHFREGVSMGPPDPAAKIQMDAVGYFGAGGGMGVLGGMPHSTQNHSHAPATTKGGFSHGGPHDLSARAAALHAGINAKRPRVGEHGLPGGLQGMPMEGAHQDALMELARENLLLKHQLHVATLEMSRLSAVLNGYEEQTTVEEPTKHKQAQSRYWTDQEHQRFLEAIQNFGHKDVKAIASVVGTRSATQVRTHAQKYFMKIARFQKQETNDKGRNSNPDAAPSETAEDDNCTGTAAAAAAAAGEAGTSAAAAAAFVAASHSKQGIIQKSSSSSKSSKSTPAESTSKKQQSQQQQTNPPTRASIKKNPGSPGSMDSGRSGGSSDGTSNGRSHGTTSNDNTNGNGSSSSNNSNRNGNEGSCSDSGRGDSNNGVSSNEGSDHGFFDTGEEEQSFDMHFQNGDDNAKTGFEFAETEAAST